MPEYVQSEPNNLIVAGMIVDKWYSVDPSVIQGKPNILQVDRALFRTLTKYHKREFGRC